MFPVVLLPLLGLLLTPAPVQQSLRGTRKPRAMPTLSAVNDFVSAAAAKALPSVALLFGAHHEAQPWCVSPLSHLRVSAFEAWCAQRKGVRHRTEAAA